MIGGNLETRGRARVVEGGGRLKGCPKCREQKILSTIASHLLREQPERRRTVFVHLIKLKAAYARASQERRARAPFPDVILACSSYARTQENGRVKRRSSRSLRPDLFAKDNTEARQQQNEKRTVLLAMLSRCLCLFFLCFWSIDVYTIECLERVSYWCANAER